MNLSFLIAAATETQKSGIGATLDKFGWNPAAFFFQVISFSIVAFLLHRFAYQPVLAMLEERRQRIQEGVEGAEKIKLQLADAQKQAEKVIAEANVAASKMIEETRAAAKQISERESQRAVQQATEIIQKAREAGEAEQKRLMAELRKDLSRLIVETTAKVTGKVLTHADQRTITEEAAKELAA